MPRDDDYHRWFDVLMTYALRKQGRTRVEHLMKDPPPPFDETAVRHEFIADHIEKARKVRSLTVAIAKVCRDLGISKRTAWRAWTARLVRNGRKPKSRNKA